MQYFVIGEEDAVLGLGLVGVRGRIVSDAGEAADAFRSAIESGEVGILLITEDAADMIREQVDRFVFAEEFPLVLELPGRGGWSEGRPSLRAVVNNAIGINL